MSFKSLVNKLVKEGKSREAATKIAGKVANAKMKGAGSGPTAKQKARMKKGSPAKMEDKTKKSPAKMKKQGYNARLDDSLGAKHGKKKQSMKSRRDESEGMEKSMKRRKFSGNKSSAQGSAAKMNGKNPKVYKTKKQDADTDGRMIKTKDISASAKRNRTGTTNTKQTIKNVNVKKGEVKKTKYVDKRDGSTPKTKVKVKGGKNRVLKTDADYRAEAARKSPAKFNAGLKKASADGKLDNNPKFKAAVDASPAKMKGDPKKKKIERLKKKRDKQLDKDYKVAVEKKNPKRARRINDRAYRTNERIKKLKEELKQLEKTAESPAKMAHKKKSPVKKNGNGKKVKGSYTQSTKRQKITGTKTVSPKKGKR